MDEQCDICGSMHFIPLGVLGSLMWFRCQACGMDQSVPNEECEEA